MMTYTDEEDEMAWETTAKDRVRKMLLLSKWDFDNKSVTSQVEQMDHHGPELVNEVFTSREDLLVSLSEAAEAGWNEYVPYDGGEPVFECDGLELAEAILEEMCCGELKKIGWD